MKKAEKILVKELYSIYLNAKYAIESNKKTYSNPKDVKIIYELLYNKNILNPVHFKPLVYDCKITDPTKLDSNTRQNNLWFEYTGKGIESVFTIKGEEYFFNYLNKNWYQILKERWWVSLIVDIIAIIAFFIGLYLSLKE